MMRRMLTLRVQISALPLGSVVEDAALLERPAGNQSSPRRSLVLLARLPPVGVVLAHDVQHIAALEGQACLLAGDIRIDVRVIVKVGAYPHLGLPLGTLVVRRNQLEGDGALGVLLFQKKI